MSEIFKTFNNLNFLHGFGDRSIRCQIISQCGSQPYFEDAYLMGTKDHVFGVFDGDSGKKLITMEISKDYYWTGGRYASECAANVFCQEKKELIEMAEDANEAILKKMLQFNDTKIFGDKINLDKKEELWQTTCTAIKLNEDKKESYFDWIKIGESYIAVIFSDRSYEILGNSVDRNSDRCGIDGISDYKKFVEQGTKSLEGIDTILLFTDGFTFPQKNIDNYLDPSLIACNYSDLEKKDLCNIVQKIKFERNRYSIDQAGHDDMTAIAIKF